MCNISNFFIFFNYTHAHIFKRLSVFSDYKVQLESQNCKISVLPLLKKIKFSFDVSGSLDKVGFSSNSGDPYAHGGAQ